MTDHRADTPGKPLSVDDDPQRTLDAKAALQAAIDEVFGAFAGSPPDDVRAALDEQRTRRGLPEQPRPWVDSVVSEIAGGHVVIVDARYQLPE